MKAIILAAGYGARMYPLTLDKPKSLLCVAGKSVLNYLIENLEKVSEIDKIYIVVNQKFHAQFAQWLNGEKFTKQIILVNDKTTSEETKLGAIGDLCFCLETENISTDILVVAGDNIFTFMLADLVKFFNDKKNTLVATHIVPYDKICKYSSTEINNDALILSFEEKPKAPKSNIAGLPVYIFAKENLSLIAELRNN